LQEVAKGGDPVFLVTLKEAGGPRGPVSPYDEEELSPEWDMLVGAFADVFPEEHPWLPPEMDELQAQLAVLLEKGLICPSTSPWGAPVLFAPKSDGGLRMCLDYRAINKGTIKDKNPIPRVDEIFDRLQGAKHFATLDLRYGYYQIKVREQDIPKTCIRTRYGSFEFLVMPFGFTNAPSVFQALMNTIFRDLVDVYVMCYLDDILVYSKNLVDHKQHIQEVLRRLRQEKLFCKRYMCHFNRQEVKFLGHVVGPRGVAMQPDKVAAIQDWPTLSCKVELQAFLGLANYYRRFIANF
jgi:hypothetical protein